MKKIILSIIAVSVAGFSTYAQSVIVTQGNNGDNSQQGNQAVVSQETNEANYTVNSYSPYSSIGVTQTIKATATNNFIGAQQLGSANYTSQTQTGLNNSINLTQNNTVAGWIGGNGNVSYQQQGGENNVQNVYQATNSSLANDGGNLLVTFQQGVNGYMEVIQLGDGQGHYALVSQGAASENGDIMVFQMGSNQSATVEQFDGSNNVVAVGQESGLAHLIALDDPTVGGAAGNTISVLQIGGDNNSVRFAQLGGRNTASITQTGNRNAVYYDFDVTEMGLQLGYDNDAKITQTGDDNFTDIAQIGNSNILSATQSQNGTIMLVRQIGNENKATISQTGY